MTRPQKNPKAMSDTELHEWIASHKPGTDEHFIGIQELIRRNGAPVRKREMIAMGIAIVSIAVAIYFIVTTSS